MVLNCISTLVHPNIWVFVTKWDNTKLFRKKVLYVIKIYFPRNDTPTTNDVRLGFRLKSKLATYTSFTVYIFEIKRSKALIHFIVPNSFETRFDELTLFNSFNVFILIESKWQIKGIRPLIVERLLKLFKCLFFSNLV